MSYIKVECQTSLLTLTETEIRDGLRRLVQLSKTLENELGRRQSRPVPFLPKYGFRRKANPNEWLCYDTIGDAVEAAQADYNDPDAAYLVTQVYS